MNPRQQRDKADVARFMPANTRHTAVNGRDVWIFSKSTEVGVDFEIGIYYDPDEDVPGYCASLISPAIEDAWKSPHIGHIFRDGAICFGGTSWRTRKTLLEAYSKSCLWAEGMAIMIVSHLHGQPAAFPFSNNNNDSEVA